MAQASLFVLELDEETYKANIQSMLSHINVGTGKDIIIREMVETMKEGLATTYEWYLNRGSK